MIRTLWFLANLVANTAWYGIKGVGAGLLRVPNRPGGVHDECARRWSRNILRSTGVELRVAGWERVPQDVPVVYASNHQSWFDIWALAASIPTQVRFVAKKELNKVPLLAGAMRAGGHISIDRQNRQSAFGAYEQAAQAIRRGLSAVVFPEGTRSRTGELQPFKKGPFVLAIAAQVPIVPAYVAGTFTLLPKGSLRLTPHPIALLFGSPISTAGMGYEDRDRLMSETRAAIEQLRVDAARVLG